MRLLEFLTPPRPARADDVAGQMLAAQTLADNGDYAGALAIWLDFRRRLRPVLGGLQEALRVVEEASSAGSLHDRFSSIDQRLEERRVHT